MSAPRQLSVLLVDDSALVCARMRQLLEEDSRVLIVGVAASSAEGLRQFECLAPDVVVLDIGLPDTSGLVLLRTLKNRRPSCVVIMLTASEECREKALALGADHFCDKGREFMLAAEIVKRMAEFSAGKPKPQSALELDPTLQPRSCW